MDCFIVCVCVCVCEQVTAVVHCEYDEADLEDQSRCDRKVFSNCPLPLRLSHHVFVR
jgi:hypothetical protein